MEAGQKENLLERQLKKLKTERDQLRYEIERLEPVEDEKYKWKVRAEHDHEKREEMMKSYEKMMDIVQTHATNLATRAATVNQQNPGPPPESNQAAREASQTQPTTPPLMPYHFPPNYIPQNNNPEANQAFGSQNTTSQQTIFINSQGESQRPHATLASKEIHQSQNPATEDSQSKEKLQILEERLRFKEAIARNWKEKRRGNSCRHHLIKKISNVKTPMKVIFEELCEFGGIKGLTETERSNDKEMKCGFHCSDEHSIEECDEFKQILQSMMDAHLIQISCESEGREVSMIEESAVPRKQECTDVEPAVSTLPTEEQTTSMPKPLDIHYVKGTPSPAPCGIRPLTIRIPTPFPYKSTKAVPWKYDVQALARDAIINISGIGGITRSGRIYTPEKLQGEQSKETFEIANASYVREGAQIVRPRMSDASIMVARVMLKKGYQPGQGLGKFLNGVTKMPSSIEKKDRCGLGYQPTKADKKRFAEEKKEKRMAGWKIESPKLRGFPFVIYCRASGVRAYYLLIKWLPLETEMILMLIKILNGSFLAFQKLNSPTGRSSNFL
ncbi:G-patch domain [Sesbania bispinosa]|nr:G-patch domain [Sesbania bispinosa]